MPPCKEGARGSRKALHKSAIFLANGGNQGRGSRLKSAYSVTSNDLPRLINLVTSLGGRYGYYSSHKEEEAGQESGDILKEGKGRVTLGPGWAASPHLVLKGYKELKTPGSPTPLFLHVSFSLSTRVSHRGTDMGSSLIVDSVV